MKQHAYPVFQEERQQFALRFGRGCLVFSMPAATPNCTLKPTCRNRRVFAVIVACGRWHTWAIIVPTPRQAT
jgi:hypothetical protein